MSTRRGVVAGLSLLAVLSACSTDPVSSGPLGVGSRTASVQADDENGGGISVSLSPAPLSVKIPVGESLQLHAVLTNPAGHAVPSNRPVEWAIFGSSSPKETIATLSDDGVLTGVRPGSVIVIATVNQGSVMGKYEVCDTRSRECCRPDDKKCKEPPKK